MSSSRRSFRRLSVGMVGCLAALLAATGAHARGPATAGWLVSALPVAASAASSFSEPGVVAGPDGALLADACTANSGSPATLWRSADNGGRWSTGITAAPSGIGCGDTDAAVGSDGYEYTLVLGAGVDVYRSRNGIQWQGPAMFPPPHGEDQPDRPWLVTPRQHPNVVYLFNSEVGGNIVEWTSTDHAQTFQGPVAVTGGLNSQAALTLGSRPLTDPADPNRMYEYYETASIAGLAATTRSSMPAEFPFGQLWEASSTDAGHTWSNQVVLDLPTAFGGANGTLGHLLPATTIDGHGRRYIVVSVQLGNQTATHLYLMHSGSRGWSRPAPIGERTSSNVMPAVAIAPSGSLLTSWYASSARDFTAANASWVETVAATPDPLAANPRSQIRRLSGVRPVHIGGVDGMGAVGNDIGQNWALRDFQSIVMDSCGQPHVVWADDAGSTPRAYVASLGSSVCRGR